MTEKDTTIVEYFEELPCQYCGAKIKGRVHPRMYCGPGSPLTAKEALEYHEKECSENPESPEGKLLRDIKRCQIEARIFNCLNCQHYQKRCKGRSN